MLEWGVDYATVVGNLGCEILSAVRIYFKRVLEVGRDAINTIMFA
jgi:hypothetical protein